MDDDWLIDWLIDDKIMITRPVIIPTVSGLYRPTGLLFKLQNDSYFYQTSNVSTKQRLIILGLGNFFASPYFKLGDEYMRQWTWSSPQLDPPNPTPLPILPHTWSYPPHPTLLSPPHTLDPHPTHYNPPPPPPPPPPPHTHTHTHTLDPPHPTPHYPNPTQWVEFVSFFHRQHWKCWNSMWIMGKLRHFNNCYPQESYAKSSK